MKFLSFIVLFSVIALGSCQTSQTSNNSDKTMYAFVYYYNIDGNRMGVNHYILASDSLDAYRISADSFLLFTKQFLDTANLRSSEGIVPVTFMVNDSHERQLDISVDIVDSIYRKQNINGIDTSKLSRYFVQPVVEKPPILIVRSWITHNSINDPEAHIQFKNVSRKTMDGIKVSIACYNNFGDRVSYGLNDTFNGISQDKLSPGHSDTYTWTLSLFDNTTKIKPSITEVHFSDGSDWKF